MIITLAFSVGFTPRDERVKNSQFANGLLDAPPCGGTMNLFKGAADCKRKFIQGNRISVKMKCGSSPLTDRFDSCSCKVQ